MVLGRLKADLFPSEKQSCKGHSGGYSFCIYWLFNESADHD
jgi:hypothetical protein